jgi:hypothetical protein
MKSYKTYLMKKQLFIVAMLLLFFTSCIVQSPKYASLEQAMSLHLGMSKSNVEETLGIQPYDIKARNDSSNVFIYVYRVIDRKTISIYTRSQNGKKSTGKYVQLEVTYSKDNNVTKIESCNQCPDNLVTKSSVDFAKISEFVTVTLPVILIYFGLKNQ